MFVTVSLDERSPSAIPKGVFVTNYSAVTLGTSWRYLAGFWF